LAVRGRDSSSGFLVFELVIPGRITIYPVEGECWQSADEIKHEIVIKMKNKLDPALLRPSNLSYEIKKDTKIS
jgi:hypothetical protein